MKYKVLVSRICYQQEWFEVDAPHEGYVDTVAIELAAGFDWGDNPTLDVEFQSIDLRGEDYPKQERYVTVIFGEMEYDDEETCIIISEETRMYLPISTAENIAREYVEKGAYENFVIPELYTGTIL